MSFTAIAVALAALFCAAGATVAEDRTASEGGPLDLLVPDVLLPAHSAALGVTFYDGTRFPQRYRNGAFVALHGSWNRSVAAGYKVVFVPMTNGRPGPIEDFVSNMLVNNGENGSAIEAWGRPVGVTVARDGSLLVSDDGSNVIWKVSVKQ